MAFALLHFLLLWTPHSENTAETCLMVKKKKIFIVRSFSEPTISQISSGKTELCDD